LTTAHFQSHYIPNTEQEQVEMLATLGLTSIDELFQDIPDEFRNPPLNLPAPLSELEIQKELGELAAGNRALGSGPSFLGAGSYHHFIPAIVKALMTRGEFLTAYTPYQPEVSQGTLQATYDFQTMICNLLGMEVADAGMYDGASSLAEAALMACRITGRGRVAILDTVSATYRQVMDTYTSPQGIETYPLESGSPQIPGDVACIIAQSPNFFGYLEDLELLEQAAHDKGALLVVSTNPTAMGLFKPPGDYGADIVTGEAQPLGISLSFGGPYLGLFASKMEYVRQMPGRIAGKTLDSEGRTGYVLTLSTREQHIRRERATSNICTNQALMTLASTVYMAALGKRGLMHVAELCYHKAHYAASLIGGIPGFSIPYQGTFFHEFTVRCPVPPGEINRRLLERNIIGGLDISGLTPNGLLLCVTEMNTREDIESLASALSEFST
jgi:glycine dehydrogenase subunit 1